MSLPDNIESLSLLKASRNTVFGTGEVKTAVTDLDDIGKFVARIIADPRTLNRYVFIAGEEVTQNKVFAIAEEVTGRTIPRIYKSKEEFAKEALADSDDDVIAKNIRGYLISVWFNEDNTVEKAKQEDYGAALDARVLYPDVKVKTLRSWTQEFYAKLN